MSVNISVVICAFNREQNIKTLLDCFLVQEVPQNCAFEVLVVDNNSRDQTKEAVESFIPKFAGRLRYYFEGHQGKSHALNLGIKEARGEILAFVDDDCLVDRDYIAQVYHVFKEYGSKIDFMGGRILPHWEEGACPAWISETLFDENEYDLNNELYWRRMFYRGPLAILDYGQRAFCVDLNHSMYKSFLFYGPNMAIRKNVLDSVGGYALDRVITQDTEMCLRLITAGKKGRYIPDVKVYHRILVSKLTPQYYRDWYFKRGKFLGSDYHQFSRKFYHPLGISNMYILRTIKLFIKAAVAKSPLDQLRYHCLALFNLGHMAEIAKKNIV